MPQISSDVRKMRKIQIWISVIEIRIVNNKSDKNDCTFPVFSGDYSCIEQKVKMLKIQ